MDFNQLCDCFKGYGASEIIFKELSENDNSKNQVYLGGSYEVLQEIPRRLTPRECARLQGFPDTFKIVVSDTQAYKQFGNSVVVPLMTAVAEIVVKKVEELDNRKTSSGQNGEERAS